VLFGNILSSTPHVESGRLRALAVAATERVDVIRALPTIAETVPGFEAASWYG